MIETTPLLHIREAAVRALAEADVLPAGWAIRDLRRLAERSLLVALGPAAGDGVLIEWHEPAEDESIPAFLIGERFSVAYRGGPGAWNIDDPQTPVAVKRATARSCQVLAALEAPISLVAHPEGDGGVPGAQADVQVVPFGAEEFARWLGAGLAVGDELVDGWRLTELYPFGPEELAVAFGRPDDEMQPRIKLRPRDDERPAARGTRSLDVSYTLPFGRGVDGERARLHAALASELALVLEALDRGVRFELRAAPGASGGAVDDTPPWAINLAIPAPCGLRCAFCSVHDEIHPSADAEPAYIEALRTDLVRAAGRGTKVLRLNGMEPLNAPYVFELLDLARAQGFEQFHILSTFLPTADRAMAERLLQAMPGRYRLYVPIYGSCPEVHDAITGLPGSFDALLQAVGHFRELMPSYPGGELIFTTILMAGNAADMVALSMLVKPLGRWWEVHLPFPNTSSSHDRYREVALSMRRALEVLYPEGSWPIAQLDLGEGAPCVALDHQGRTGHALITAQRVREGRTEPAGTFYETIGFTHSLGDGEPVAFTSATVPCPHADGCAMALACPRKVYAAYADRFGLDELRPITERELAELNDGPTILDDLRQRGEHHAAVAAP